MDENAVVNATCKNLEQQGFVISQRLSTVERGVDIIAEEISTGCRVFIEAKGGTSSLEAVLALGSLIHRLKSLTA